MQLIDNWHIGAICEHLEAVTNGEIKRLLINIPPGHAKSLLVSVLWPAWVWTRRPSWRGLFGSYAEALALRDSIKCRALVEHAWYVRNFMRTRENGGLAEKAWSLTEDQNTKGLFKNTLTGERMSISVGGKATGFRGNCVVVDDPLNALEATSTAALERAVFWYDVVMSTRLNDPRNDAMIVIMQRLHESDVSGHILAQGGYEHLCLPSEYEPKRKTITFINRKLCACPRVEVPVRYFDDAGDERMMMTIKDCGCARTREKFWEDPRDDAGALLFPELFPSEVLAGLKKKLGSSGFAGQHQQRPAPEEGERFKKTWWRFWRHDGTSDKVCARPEGCNLNPARVLPVLDRVIISLDATFKEGKKNDFVVFQVWGVHKADRFLLDQVRKRMSFTDTLSEFRRLVQKWPMAKRKIVEDKANGPAIINSLEREVAGIIAIEPEGGKEARASAVQPEVESGNVYLEDGANYIDEFVEELAAFPNGAHDDQVDAMSQALNDLAGSSAITRLKALAQR